MRRLAALLLVTPLTLAACSGSEPAAGREAAAPSSEVADTVGEAESSLSAGDPSAEESGPRVEAWLTKDTRLCIANDGNEGFLIVPVNGTKGETIDSDELGSSQRCYESDNGRVGVGSLVRILYDSGDNIVVALHNQPFERPDLTVCRAAANAAFCETGDNNPNQVQWTLSQGDRFTRSALGHRYQVTRNPDSSFIEATLRTLKD